MPSARSRVVGTIAAWTWSALAGVGGLAALVVFGPWPLTNGWFALFSGVAACPGTASALEKYAGVRFSGRARLVTAVLLFVARRIAVALLPGTHGARGAGWLL